MTLHKEYERLISQHVFRRSFDPITQGPDGDELVALYVNQRPRRNPSLIYLIRPETLLDWLCRHNGSPNLWLNPVNGPMDVYEYRGKRRSLLFCKYLLDCPAGKIAKPLAFKEAKPDYIKTLGELGKKRQALLYNERSDRLKASLRDLRPEKWEVTVSRGPSRQSIAEQLREYRSVREPATLRALADALVPTFKIEDERAWTANL